jgi:hypothetical protein
MLNSKNEASAAKVSIAATHLAVFNTFALDISGISSYLPL